MCATGYGCWRIYPSPVARLMMGLRPRTTGPLGGGSEQERRMVNAKVIIINEDASVDARPDQAGRQPQGICRGSGIFSTLRLVGLGRYLRKDLLADHQVDGTRVDSHIL